MTIEKIEGFEVIIERKDDGYHAKVPELAGCVAKAGGIDEVKRAIRRQIAYRVGDHIMEAGRNKLKVRR